MESLSKPVISAADGRIRLRSAALRDPGHLHEVEQSLYEIEGVTKVSACARAGSILIHYDTQQAGLEEMKARVAAVVGARKRGAPKPSRRAKDTGLLSNGTASRLTNLGMLASLGIAFIGSRRTHRASGKVFLGLLAIHLYLNRKKLLRDIGLKRTAG